LPANWICSAGSVRVPRRPPRILGSLRRALGPTAAAAVAAEVGKDLTKHPIHEIERLLTAEG